MTKQENYLVRLCKCLELLGIPALVGVLLPGKLAVGLGYRSRVRGVVHFQDLQQMKSTGPTEQNQTIIFFYMFYFVPLIIEHLSTMFNVLTICKESRL